ncbi:hypothetical protein [Clostridium sp.]|uniref:hypothetical protein n=1 Tax=Clostridium sp. TaxID=1506 RepID=UPI0026130E71|nr:hypothetical protein [Clostridium sp.]
MANIKKKVEDSIEEKENSVEAEQIINGITEKDEKIKSLEMQLAELKGMLITLSNNQGVTTNQTPQIIDKTSKMDKPCTLIHLTECSQGLPDTIFVNNIKREFSRFGEKRTFRYSEMQEIINHYSGWFERGIFALAEDCDDFEEEFSIKSIKTIPVNIYKKIEQLNDIDFENIIKDLSKIQRINLARTWIQRYLVKTPGYDNINKVRILNKYTRIAEKEFKEAFSQIIAQTSDEKEKLNRQKYMTENKVIFKEGLTKGLLEEIENKDDNEYEE